ERRVPVAVALCKLRIGPPGVAGFLTSGLGANQDRSLRKVAAEALGWCDEEEVDVVPALLTAALSDKDEQVRQIAEASLARLRLSHEQAMRLCSKQLKDSPLAEAALRSGGEGAVPVLADALGAEDPTPREKAAKILGHLGEAAAGAVPALTEALEDKDVNVRLAAAKALWNVTKKAEAVVPALAALLEGVDARPQDGEARRRFRQTV